MENLNRVLPKLYLSDIEVRHWTWSFCIDGTSHDFRAYWNEVNVTVCKESLDFVY